MREMGLCQWSSSWSYKSDGRSLPCKNEILWLCSVRGLHRAVTQSHLWSQASRAGGPLLAVSPRWDMVQGSVLQDDPAQHMAGQDRDQLPSLKAIAGGHLTPLGTEVQVSFITPRLLQGFEHPRDEICLL